jgi:hypothetical protein
MPPEWKGKAYAIFIKGDCVSKGTVEAGTDGGTDAVLRCPLNLLGCGENFAIIVQLEAGGMQHAFTLSLSRKTLAADPEFDICPVLLNGMPRSGTTFLMEQISRHRDIFTMRQYPFEHRFAYYWVHLFKVLSSPSSPPFDNWKYQWDFDSIGPSPYFPYTEEVRGWFSNDHVECLANYVRRSISGLYSNLAGGACHYFLEKFPGRYVGLFRELFPKTREIVIVRDFRDVYYSIKAFNEKRGTVEFNRGNFASERDFCFHLGNVFRGWRNYVERAGDQVILVKYEDVVVDADKPLNDIFVELGLNPRDCATIAPDSALTGASAYHKTTNNVLKSVGRWKNHREDVFINEVSEAYLDCLEFFKY